ncbi:hypothetical protein VUR80DRAFT_4889 [Thermomyces stellatus]
MFGFSFSLLEFYFILFAHRAGSFLWDWPSLSSCPFAAVSPPVSFGASGPGVQIRRLLPRAGKPRRLRYPCCYAVLCTPPAIACNLKWYLLWFTNYFFASWWLLALGVSRVFLEILSQGGGTHGMERFGCQIAAFRLASRMYHHIPHKYRSRPRLSPVRTTPPLIADPRPSLHQAKTPIAIIHRASNNPPARVASPGSLALVGNPPVA